MSARQDGQIAASEQSSTPTTPAQVSAGPSTRATTPATTSQSITPATSTRSTTSATSAQSFAPEFSTSLFKADCVVNAAPPLPSPVTERKKRFKFAWSTIRRLKAQLTHRQPNQEQEQAKAAGSHKPVPKASCDACGQVYGHITRICPEPKECALCFLPGHDVEDCEDGFLASFGRGTIKPEPGEDEHPDARRRAMQAVIVAMKRVEKTVQEAYEEREKKLEVGITDSQRATLAAFRRPMRDFWEMIQAYQDLHFGADDAYSTFLISLEQQKAARESAEQTEAVEMQADPEAVI
ncbi:hypothetical protein FB567DRAFT_554344 [Paraphoma chrysanthemicola]|uniref:Uncharacterized protein n=1 Tax=Paraphoma chrysanthemicola TaxID=798071 RepID=A0A8K0QUT5_9PLEO|nr:hypothetical protein FB567DRAFT_554344 [Paraphoma chrysanthemicola]